MAEIGERHGRGRREELQQLRDFFGVHENHREGIWVLAVGKEAEKKEKKRE